MPNAVALPDDVAELTSRLARQGLGAVIDVSDLTRALYSSDASLYRVVPRAVARPRTIDEAEMIMGAARAVGLPVTTRGAGTSCAGNAVGPGLILDTSRHLNRVIGIDAEARTARSSPGWSRPPSRSPRHRTACVSGRTRPPTPGARSAG